MIDSHSIEEFRTELELRQIELLEDCTTDNANYESFIRACSEILSDSGMLTDEPEIVLIDESGFRVDAICWPEEGQHIVEFLLFIEGNKSDEETKSEITNAFNKTIAILHNLCKPTKRIVPESVDQLIRKIQKIDPTPESILVRIITTSSISVPNLTKRFATTLKNSLPNGIYTDVRFCGIEDLYTNKDGGIQGPTIQINEDIITCFIVHEMVDHDVYLAALPGYFLAQLYQDYGQRLLQKNVRAFLGMKGKRNQKIQETILKFPQRFLAYNNGLTITVSGIQLENQHFLKQMDNLQIVNGGQTIAILANEFRANDPDCLSSVIVMAKIIHVKHKEKHMEWIEKIAETSNTQNAIKDADLSSHNPIYRKIKEISSMAVFRKGTEQYKWYFSRVRKEYEAELAANKKRSHIELKKFEDMYPKAYTIDKGIVARVETIFARRPWVSSRGEAKCQVDFLGNMQDGFEPDLNWYRNMISKVILVKHATSLARDIGIGEGRSCIVEYACAIMTWVERFQEYLSKTQSLQEVPPQLDEMIKNILRKTQNYFISLGTDRSLKEHAKREDTWNSIKEEAKSKGWINE
jgi:hypothetical protein